MVKFKIVLIVIPVCILFFLLALNTDINNTSEGETSVAIRGHDGRNEIYPEVNHPITVTTIKPPYDPPIGSTTESVRLPIKYFSYSSSFELQPHFDLNGSNNFVIHIMSAITEVDLRRIIRDTWANLNNIRKYDGHNFTVQLMFVIGGLKFVAQSVREEIYKEQEVHGDLLSIDNMEDSYDRLTEKTLYSLHYVTNTFPLDKIDFLFKIDSDNFINIFQFLNVAWKYHTGKGPIPDFICYWRGKTKVVRLGKYREPRYRFADDMYPEYCSGPGYLSSRKVIPRLMNASVSVPILRSEDVMLTGVGLKSTGPIHVHKLRRKDTYFDRYLLDATKRRTLIDTFPDKYYAHQLPLNLWTPVYQNLLRHFL